MLVIRCCLQSTGPSRHPGLVQHQHPAQHRYPVWWTGDGVDLEVRALLDFSCYFVVLSFPLCVCGGVGFARPRDLILGRGLRGLVMDIIFRNFNSAS